MTAKQVFDYAGFSVTLDQAVAHLELNNPQRANCLTSNFFADLSKALSQMAKKGALVMMITGQGDNFSAGIDLSFLGNIEPFTSQEDSKALSFLALVKDFQAALTALEKAPFPVLVGVQGFCLGAALDLIAACDVRFGMVASSYAIAEINVGLMADLGSLQRLPLKMHEGLVRYMAFTGNSIDGKKAGESGLLTFVFDDYASMVAAMQQQAREIVSKEASAVSATKRVLNFVPGHTVQQSLHECARLQLSSIDLSTVRAKVMAILESLKRKRKK